MTKIILNGVPETLPHENMTIADLLEWKDINTQGTAVAIDNKLIKKDKWSTTTLSDHEEVNIISAAFGG